MDKKLIIDIGMHKCEDTDFYLHMGYRVIAIDANIDLVNQAKSKYSRNIENGSLVVLNYAMSGEDFGKIDFNVSDQTLWSSIKPEVSTRLGHQSRKVVVETRTLGSIVREFGVPYYCKIDAAGNEDVCLSTLTDPATLPEYISVESECIGEGQELTEQEALVTLNRLFELGYRHFKLVDQATLSVLKLKKKFYYNDASLWNKLTRRLNRIFVIIHQTRYLGNFKYKFRPSASGPFGVDLDGKWIDFDSARQLMIRHRRDYFNRSMANAKRSFSFWCDWHATK